MGDFDYPATGGMTEWNVGDVLPLPLLQILDLVRVTGNERVGDGAAAAVVDGAGGGAEGQAAAGRVRGLRRLQNPQLRRPRPPSFSRLPTMGRNVWGCRF